jgi:hypothetical protein
MTEMLLAAEIPINMRRIVRNLYYALRKLNKLVEREKQQISKVDN